MKWKNSFFWSILLHSLILFFLIWAGFQSDLSSISPLFEQEVDIIEATAIIDKPIKPKPQKETPKEKEEPPKIVGKEEERIETKKVEEDKRAIQLKKQEELKKQKEKQEAEEKARKEKEAKEKTQAEAAEKQRQEEEAEERAELARAHKAKLQQGKIDQYKALIRQKIQRSFPEWELFSRNLTCKLKVRILPGGVVVGVKVVESSGNSAFDAAAQRATFKASPLPVPEDPDLFQEFKSLTFPFKPEEK